MTSDEKLFEKENIDLSDAHFVLANTLKFHKKNYQAIQNYKQVLIINPNHIEALSNLGVIYLEHLHFKEAVEVFQKLINIAPEYPGVGKNLEVARKQLKINKIKLEYSDYINKFSGEDSIYDENHLIVSYLDLLKKCLTDTLHLNHQSEEYILAREGLDCPLKPETMIGIKRHKNIHYCNETGQDKNYNACYF